MLSIISIIHIYNHVQMMRTWLILGISNFKKAAFATDQGGHIWVTPEEIAALIKQESLRIHDYQVATGCAGLRAYRCPGVRMVPPSDGYIGLSTP